MSQKQVKLLRSQIRNVVQEMLPALLQTEVFSELYTRLHKENAKKLETVHSEVTASLVNMTKRNDDVQSYIIRQVNETLARNANSNASELVNPIATEAPTDPTTV